MALSLRPSPLSRHLFAKSRLAVVIATLFAVSAFAQTKSLDQLLEAMRASGYSASLVAADRGTTAVRVERVRDTEERHGTQQVQWKLRETWTLYYAERNNSLELVLSNSMTEQRAPVLGQWHKIETRPPALPAELRPKALRAE